jgi:Cu/Ag efflux pump CusA
VDPKRLGAKGVTLDQVIATAGNAMWVSPLSFLQASTPGSGGFVDGQNQRLGITHRQPIATAQDLSQVIVEGTKLPLSSVASVVENHQPLIGDAVVNAAPGLLLVIEKLPGANTLEVTRRVEAALEGLRPGLSGVTIDSKLFQPATFLKSALANLQSAFLIGAFLVALALFALLRDWRSAVVGLVSILAALFAAMVVLYLSGATLNVVLLAGLVLALGAIIDDAIQDAESLARRLRQPQAGDFGKSALAIVLESSMRVRMTVFYAALVAVAAVLPLYALSGFTGAFFGPLVGAYLLATLASMAVALTVAPALCLILFRRAEAAPEDAQTEPRAHFLETLHDRLVAPVVTRPSVALVAFGVIAVAGLAVWPQLHQGSLLPEFQERDLVLSWSGAPGASREAMMRTATDLSRELRAIPGVQSASAHVGRAVTSDEVVGINAGKVWVSLDPKADREATVAAVREKLKAHPEFAGAQTYLKKITDDAVAGASNALVVRVYGQELDVLTRKAQEVEAALEGVNGLSSPKIVNQTEQPILEVKVDLKAAQAYGLKPGDVRRAATTMVNGIEVGSLFESQKVFDVVVVGTPATKANVDGIKAMLIDTPGGSSVRLAEVANVREVPTPSVVRRQGNSRWIDIEANVQGRDFGAVVADVNARLAGITFPLEYHPELLGEYAQVQDAQRRGLGFGLAAALGIFLVLQAAFRSWRLALVGFASVIASLAGGVVAAVLTGTPTSLGMLAGLLALVGLAARGQIAFVHRCQQLEGLEGASFGPDLVRRAARERFAPLLTATVATALAFLPVLFLGNVAGLEVLRPMAVVLLGGLVTSGVINALVLPAFYLRLREQPEAEFDFSLSEAFMPSVRSADATD